MTDHDISATARLLGVSERTVRRWLREGRIAGYRVGGRVRIPDRAVREAARPYGTSTTGGAAPPPGEADPIVAWLGGADRLRERRTRAAALMDEIRAQSIAPSGPGDTVEAYIRQEREAREAAWDRRDDRDRP